jgi:hypothetical protein
MGSGHVASREAVQVAKLLARQNEDHALGDLGGVIADAFDVLRDRLKPSGA